jgi:cellulose synthase/poly-beta-1,6-N-acetylglucosamine synthase-like glycosyltransferase
MVFELLIYPFLFAAIYFQAFLLVTLLSTPAVEMRARKASVKTPKVAMVVPCWNEETTVAGTAKSLLALDYPKDKLQIYLINDGSTDNTKAAMDAFAGNPQVTIIHKENGGKHSAINLGIELASDAEFIGCLDADSFVDPSALKEIISCFDDPKVAAATPGMSVHAPSTLLERMQQAEFVLGIALRHILAAVNGLHVTPGPFSLYRRSVLMELGGFRFGHQTEDMEMALRIQKAGYAIDSAPRARVFTKVPRSVPALVKQRTRWTSGFLRNVSQEYRVLLGNPKYGALGVLILPLGFLAVFGGLIAFAATLYHVTSLLIRTYTVTEGVPLSFTLGNLVPTDTGAFFDFPISLFAALSAVAAAGIIAFTIIGKNVSKTPGALSVGMLAYLFVYGFIAPFWLLRSVRDVALNTHRGWR